MNITVTYANPKRFTTRTPMEAVVAQFETPLTEDGFLFLPDQSGIIFPVEDSRMSITVPESLNTYEQLKPLCIATRYDVNKGENDSSIIK